MLLAALTRCDGSPACAAEAAGDSVTGYDALVEQLAAAPVDLPDGDELDDGTVRSAAGNSVSDPYSRADFTEALNEALNGDVTGLAELGAAESGPDPSFSDGLFYAVECQDYDFVPRGGDARATLDDWLDVAAEAGIDDLRLGSVYYGDTPCLFWPGAGETPDVARPEPVTDPPYPVLVLNADTDPNTPVVGAQDVFADLRPDSGPRDAAIIQLYGPHVVYGRGDPCIDDPVHTFITTGQVPEQAITVCRFE